MQIGNYNFVCTCSACPEQYDVFDKDGNQVAYVRLRWGSLTAEYPDVGGMCIYDAHIGDGWSGCFQSEKQRMTHLKNIANAINVCASPIECPYCGHGHTITEDNFEDRVFSGRIGIDTSRPQGAAYIYEIWLRRVI